MLKPLLLALSRHFKEREKQSAQCNSARNVYNIFLKTPTPLAHICRISPIGLVSRYFLDAGHGGGKGRNVILNASPSEIYELEIASWLR